MVHDEVRKAIVEACRRLEVAGLVQGASGNVSVRLAPDRELCAITPSRVPYRRLTPEQVLIVDFDGEPQDGEGVPSSEALTHFAAYRARRDIGAAIHTHSVYASALAVAGREIPAVIDEQVVLLGGPVRVAEYGMSATEELARHGVEALGRNQAVLLRNHGVLAVGRDLDEALDVAELAERVAKIYVLAQLAGGARPLPEHVVETEQKLYRMQRGFPLED
jgi:L-fuculose-phosphate aldolase